MKQILKGCTKYLILLAGISLLFSTTGETANKENFSKLTGCKHISESSSSILEY